MDLTIKINMDNDAFGANDFASEEDAEAGVTRSFEVSRILSNLARAIDGENLFTNISMKLYDINGNPVGWLTVEE